MDFGVIFFIFVAFYFLPTIIAAFKRKKNSTAIGVLNFFLGWTAIGWLVALIWALTND